eukprot:6177042-Pleurochrysis_carterae.AAC.2
MSACQRKSRLLRLYYEHKCLNDFLDCGKASVKLAALEKAAARPRVALPLSQVLTPAPHRCNFRLNQARQLPHRRAKRLKYFAPARYEYILEPIFCGI